MKTASPIGLLLRATFFWFILSVPFIALYIIFDPMNALRWHEDMMPNGFLPNKGSMTILQFKHNAPKANYDSFIVGSSLGCNFLIEDWLDFLPEGATPYHFDTSAMSITQLEESIEYLCDNVTLKNVLIIWDMDWTWQTEAPWYTFKTRETPYITPPQILRNPIAAATSHWRLFSAWYSHVYMNGWICYDLIGTRPKGIKGYPKYKREYNPLTNEETCKVKDDSLAALTDSFMLAHPNFDKMRLPFLRNANQITPRGKASVRHIAEMLNESGANYYFVMAPSCHNLVPSQADDDFLRHTFGNRYILTHPDLGYLTTNPYYYYDNYHFRPAMARKIMEYVYEHKNSSDHGH